MTKKLKKTLDVILIITVFALTGSTTAFLSGIIMNVIGAEPWTAGYIVGYIFLIFPLYHTLLLLYAFILGKFNFFYSKQKKITLKLVSLFKKMIDKKTAFSELDK